jgi:hypothetical protein
MSRRQPRKERSCFLGARQGDLEDGKTGRNEGPQTRFSRLFLRLFLRLADKTSPLYHEQVLHHRSLIVALLLTSLPRSGVAQAPAADSSSTTLTDAEAAALLPAADFEIVPGERVGPIDAASTEADLKKIFGAKNVRYMNVPLGEGMEEMRTVVFPPDATKRIVLSWADEAGRRWPVFAGLDSDQLRRRQVSVWTVRPGVRLDMTLAAVGKLNGRPFAVTYEPGGPVPVASWRGGNLGVLQNKVFLVCHPTRWRSDAGEPSGSDLDTEAMLKREKTDVIDERGNITSRSPLLKGYRVWAISALFPSNDREYEQRMRDDGVSADLARAIADAEIKFEIDQQAQRACRDSSAVAWAEGNRQNADVKVRDLAGRVLDVRGATYKSRVSWLASKGHKLDPAVCKAVPTPAVQIPK